MAKEVNIAIVHFNTPLLTECLVKSINKFTPNSHIYIFDNSDKYPFVYRQDNITYYDNTKGQIINLDKLLDRYPNKTPRYWAANKCGSARHCITIQKCIDLIGKNFILLDSDVLLKKDIAPLFDESKIFVGEVGHANNSYDRVFPWLCFLNVDMMKKHGIKYFNDHYMLGLNTTELCDWYDTGAYFLMKSKKYSHTLIKDNDYIAHFASASWNAKQTIEKRNEFLNKNIKLYSDDYKEHLYVTMTSWKERIVNLKHVLSTILANTMLPERIFVNLSEEEFPGKEKDLLPEFINFIKENPIIEIRWIPGKNTKQWKKIIPTLLAYPKDAVICIDDDRTYPKDFIKTLYDEHLKNPNFPVTVDQGAKVYGIKLHCGHGTLNKLEYYGNMMDVFTEDIMQNPSSDTFFAYMCKRTGRDIIPTKYNVNKFIKLYNEVNALHRSVGTYNMNVHKDMVQLLDKKFGLSFAGTDTKKAPETKSKLPNSSEIYEVLGRHYNGEKRIQKVSTQNPVIRRHLISKSLKEFLKP